MKRIKLGNAFFLVLSYFAVMVLFVLSLYYEYNLYKHMLDNIQYGCIFLSLKFVYYFLVLSQLKQSYFNSQLDACDGKEVGYPILLLLVIPYMINLVLGAIITQSAVYTNGSIIIEDFSLFACVLVVFIKAITGIAFTAFDGGGGGGDSWLISEIYE